MIAAVRPSNLDSLEQNLHQSLESTSLQELPFNIQCSLKAGTLLVTCEHSADARVNPEQIFTDLEQIIEAIQIDSTNKVGICLKEVGHKYPYAYHSFFTNKHADRQILEGRSPKFNLGELNPQDYIKNFTRNPESTELSTISQGSITKSSGEIEITPELLEELDNPFDAEYLDRLLADAGGNQTPLLSGSAFNSTGLNAPGKEGNSSRINSWETIEVTPELLEELDNPFDEQYLDLISTQFDSQITTPPAEYEQDLEEDEEGDEENISPLALKLATVVLGIAIAIGSFYAVSRPCVIGRCEALEVAKEIEMQSAETLKNFQYSQAPTLAQQELMQASGLLEDIPFWSIRYLEVRNLRSRFQQEIKNLGQIRSALAKGAAASNLSQNPPHPLEDWQQMLSLWDEAIALLAAVPEDSKAYPFADYKLNQYRKYLIAIKGRTTTESEADAILAAARKQAQLAQTREGVARFPESWEKVEDNWQNAVQEISRIPADTSAHQQAQFLAVKYEAKLKAAEERKVLEKKGEQAYNLAVSWAQRAKTFQGQGAWENAVKSWRQALNSARQVPTVSSFYIKARPSISSYSVSLTQAEAKYLEVKRVEDARKDLSKTCTGKPLVCKYNVTQDLISVQLTADYVKKLREAAIAAQEVKNNKAESQVKNHVKILQVALEAISNNAGIPLEVYNPDGLKIGVHNPQ